MQQRPNSSTRLWRALALAAVMTTAPGCQPGGGDDAPGVTSKPAEAVAIDMAPSVGNATPPPATGAAPMGLATDKPADPSRMPKDALHAPFRGQAPASSPTRGRPAAGRGLPSGHPPVAGMGTGVSVPTQPRAAPAAPAQPEEEIETGTERPLPLKGAGGADELKRRLAAIADKSVRDRVDSAFRLTFTAERARRDPAEARRLLADLGDHPQAGAVAARIMGYVAVSTGFDVAAANAAYRRAIALDADYGEAHYALAFMLSMNDLATGRTHFERAMDLGVPDTRGIGRFYPAE